MIVLSAGMQKSGTGWYFNLTNDLLVVAGYQDVRAIRQKFRLHSILRHYNCNIGKPTPFELALVAIPHFLGNTFVVKMHGAPSTWIRFLMSTNIMKATYIYRDPRDVVISAFEHGQIIRSRGETHTFGKLDSIEASILYVKGLLTNWDKWTQCTQALIVRYEDLVADPIGELKRLAGFLSLSVSSEGLHRIVATYKIDQSNEVKGLHFNKVAAGSFRYVMNQKEQDLCKKYFRDYLQRMGYPDE